MSRSELREFAIAPFTGARIETVPSEAGDSTVFHQVDIEQSVGAGFVERGKKRNQAASYFIQLHT